MNMLYMSSVSAMDGKMQLTITFKLGTDPNIAQVLVQNRVAIAEPQLPAEVRNIGVPLSLLNNRSTLFMILCETQSFWL
jgi:multidrug efflux pump subunit AcrB